VSGTGYALEPPALLHSGTALASKRAHVQLEIYDRLNQQPKQSGIRLYQNLEALSSQGIIECIERSDGRLYGNISDSHSHVNCLDTKQILDVEVELQNLCSEIEQQTGCESPNTGILRLSAVTK